MKKLYIPIAVLLMTSFAAILTVLIIELFRSAED